MTISITVAGVAYPSPSSAADVDWAAQQVALLQALAAAVAPLTWHAVVSYGAGWTGTLQYAKNSQGRVYLRGRATATGSPGVAITTLPSGYRPPTQTLLVLQDGANSEIDSGVIATSGAISITASADAEVDFGQVSFDIQAF